MTDYSDLSNEEFDRRLREKLEKEEPKNLVSLLLRFAYDDIREDFNNEILEEWKQDNPDPVTTAEIATITFSCPHCEEWAEYSMSEIESAKVVADANKEGKPWITLYCPHCGKDIRVSKALSYKIPS